MPSSYEHAGREEALHRLEDMFYAMAALDGAGMPDDEDFREAVRSHVQLGSEVAKQNSHAPTDDELHPLRQVPRWTRPGDDDERGA